MDKGRSIKWNIARHMPPLPHSMPGEEYNILNSKVVQWLTRQPDILQIIFDSVKQTELVFDPETRLWRGMDYEQ